MPDLNSAVTWLQDSLVEHVAWVFWVWVFGLIVTGLKYIRSKRKGLSIEATNQWLGASLAVGVMIVATGLILWSRVAFVSIMIVLILVVSGRALISHRKRERVRLSRYPKGQFDYQRDLAIANRLMLASMNRITKRVTKLTLAINRMMKKPGAANRERLANAVAKKYSDAAAKLRGEGSKLSRYSADHAAAIEGIIDCVNEQTPGASFDTSAIQSTREALVTALESHRKARSVVLEMPRFSRELNAAKAEMAESIALSMDGYGITIKSCDSAIQRLSGVATPPSPSVS